VRFPVKCDFFFLFFSSFPCLEIAHVPLELHKHLSLTSTLLPGQKRLMPSLVALPAVRAWFAFAPASPGKSCSSPADPNLQQRSHSCGASGTGDDVGWAPFKPDLIHSKRGYARQADKSPAETTPAAPARSWLRRGEFVGLRSSAQESSSALGPGNLQSAAPDTC